MTKEKAQEIINHLLKTKQGFCFYRGQIVTIEYLEDIIKGKSGYDKLYQVK